MMIPYYFPLHSSHLVLPFLLPFFFFTISNTQSLSFQFVSFFGRTEKCYCQCSKQSMKSPNKHVTYLNYVVLARKRADMVNGGETLHNDTVFASSARRSTSRERKKKQKKKTILTGTHHHGEPGLPSTTVLATASPGILAPPRWGSLIRVGAHPRVLGIIKHCRFFWRGGE